MTNCTSDEVKQLPKRGRGNHSKFGFHKLRESGDMIFIKQRDFKYSIYAGAWGYGARNGFKVRVNKVDGGYEVVRL